MKAAIAVPVGVALTLLAFGVTLLTPPYDVEFAPFATTGEVGDELVSEHHVVTFRDVGLADEVELSSWRGTTAGVWFVAEATLAARVERVTVDVDLFVDGVRYESSKRSDSHTVDGQIADAGLPQTGAILIELPADILERPGAAAATLRLSPSGDTRLDSVVEVRIDLTQIERVDRRELDRVRDGAP